jgi:xanthine dehydrogenase YagS FAD-binding subunit
VTPFRYVRPSDRAGAVEQGRALDSRFIAGGTCLVDLLRLDVEHPAQLVDLGALRLASVEVAPDGALRIGALVKNSDLAYHPAVVEGFPVLSQALLSGASPQVRNMASVGGNILQRTRCAYFRDAGVSQCNKRLPGSGCAAIGGFTRMHAILGGSEHCIAAHPSDMCVALAALDATVNVQGVSGAREVPFDDFHVLPGDHPDLESVLAAGELVTAVVVP